MEPKNSLEALDNLVHCKSETKCKECHHKNVCTLERDYNIVKQDLERLAQLERENQYLKDEYDELQYIHYGSYELGTCVVTSGSKEETKLRKAIEDWKTTPGQIVVFSERGK